MSNQPSVFQFNGTAVRIHQDVNNEPWFVAKDVCDVLEIKESHRSVSLLDDDEKGRHIMTTPSGDQEMVTINESGLYSLILRSRKPEAKAFKKWVTSEVLPAIRKSGSYGAEQAVAKALEKFSDRLDNMALVLLNHTTAESNESVAMADKILPPPQNATETHFESRGDELFSPPAHFPYYREKSRYTLKKHKKKVTLKNLATGEFIPFPSLKAAVCFLGLPLGFCRRDFMGLVVYDNWQFLIDGMGERK